MRSRFLLPLLLSLFAFTSFSQIGNSRGKVAPARAQSQSARHFTLDYTQSSFIAHAQRGGLLWFKGHEHLVAARVFTGQARLVANNLAASSLQLNVKTDSMEETSEDFTAAQKKIINGELRDIVLLPAKYPEISFKSTSVNGKSIAANQYELRINGDLTLNGVTRLVEIPTKVTVTGNKLRAIGEFSISRGDFKVKATSAVHGMIRVKDKVKFTFDIVGRE